MMVNGTASTGNTGSRVSTDTLMKRVLKTRQLDRFINQNETHLEEITLADFLKKLCEDRKVTASKVIGEAQIERGYGYQIFRGIRNPSRDKLLQIAFGFGLNCDGAQQLLKVAGMSPLHPKVKRDAVVAYCLHNGRSLMDAQELLYEYALPLLGGAKHE